MKNKLVNYLIIINIFAIIFVYFFIEDNSKKENLNQNTQNLEKIINDSINELNENTEENSNLKKELDKDKEKIEKIMNDGNDIETTKKIPDNNFLKNLEKKSNNIKYTELNLIKVISQNQLLCEINGNEEIVELIGIERSDDKISTELILDTNKYNSLYIEYDIMKRNTNNNLLGYVWLGVPLEDKSNMLNSIVLKNGGIFKEEVPNIKYSQFLIEQK